MQIMSLCIMSHDWNMQMSCIIYEWQCLSKSVSHNLQSELETEWTQLVQVHCQENCFPVNAIHAFGRSSVRESKYSRKARYSPRLKVCPSTLVAQFLDSGTI